jgi:hypothetical protein
MPTNPSVNGLSSGNPGPLNILDEDVPCTNIYGYSGWANMDGLDRWFTFFLNAGAAATTNFRLEVASERDGGGIVYQITVAAALAAATPILNDLSRWAPPGISENWTPKSLRFGFKTGGAATTITVNLIGFEG